MFDQLQRVQTVTVMFTHLVTVSYQAIKDNQSFKLVISGYIRSVSETIWIRVTIGVFFIWCEKDGSKLATDEEIIDF